MSALSWRFGGKVRNAKVEAGRHDPRVVLRDQERVLTATNFLRAAMNSKRSPGRTGGGCACVANQATAVTFVPLATPTPNRHASLRVDESEEGVECAGTRPPRAGERRERQS